MAKYVMNKLKNGKSRKNATRCSRWDPARHDTCVAPVRPVLAENPEMSMARVRAKVKADTGLDFTWSTLRRVMSMGRTPLEKETIAELSVEKREMVALYFSSWGGRACWRTPSLMPQ